VAMDPAKRKAQQTRELARDAKRRTSVAMDSAKRKAQQKLDKDRKTKKRRIDAMDLEKSKATKKADAARKICERAGTPKRHPTDPPREIPMKESIEKATKQAKKYLHRTKVDTRGLVHKAVVCIICDCFIMGTDSIRYLLPSVIKEHKHRIGVKSYEAYYKAKLHKELVEQYHVRNLPGLLLSPRSRLTDRGYVTCSACCQGMRKSNLKTMSPPKFAIANGFVIGSFPEVITFINKDGEVVRRAINVEEDINDVLRAYIAPVRPYGYIFAYSGGSHKSVIGHYQYFEVDQSHVGAVMKHMDPESLGQTIFCMICGRMTPKQKDIVRRRSLIDTKLFTDILSWFIQTSGHRGYKGLEVPDTVASPVVMQDKTTNNNTDAEVNPAVENRFGGGTFYFTSPGDPTENTSTCGTEKRFFLAMANSSAPTLLSVGGEYAKSHELNVEDVLPFAFPFGIGGPTMNRRTNVSTEACIQRYFHTAMPQFMRGDVVAVLSHIYGRQASFKSGVITSRSVLDGVPLGDHLATMTSKDFDMKSPTNKVDVLMKGVTTACRALGHTPAAAKFARRCCFSMLDYFGMTSLFLTFSPDDECNWTVGVYARPQQTVSVLMSTQHSSSLQPIIYTL